MKKLVVAVIVGVIVAAAIAAIAVEMRQRGQGSAPGPPTAPVVSRRDKGARATAKKPSEPGAAAADPQATRPERTGRGLAAIEHAAEAGKYLFIFFFRDESDGTGALRRVFEAAMGRVAERAESIAINTTDPSESAIVDKFKVRRAPMPLVLAVAPNGAIVAGLPAKFDRKQLESAFATPCTEKCLKGVQQGNLVFLCVQNERTKSNQAAMQGVQDFKADARYARTTEVVMLDPDDKAEAKFLAQLRIDPKGKEATTVFLAPPASAIATFKGPTDKNTLVAALSKARSSGCGPNAKPGCCPRPKR